MSEPWSPAHLVGVARASVTVGVLPHAFQPIWDLRAGRVLGFEALARFAGGEPPQDVGEAARAESGDLWLELDRVSIASALAQARGLPGLLFVNISGLYLAGRQPHGGVVRAAIAEHRPQPRSLVIEVTEDGAGAVVGAGELPRALRERGLLLALDDADRGPYTRQRLAAFGAHFSFVKVGPQALAGGPRRLRRWVLRAAACGADVIAEGIENLAALPLLESAGVRLGQGYGLGRPLPAGHWTPELLRHMGSLAAPAG